jgi:murein DD-endopeptidase MepM/ murein hydrolase activator NlpD
MKNRSQKILLFVVTVGVLAGAGYFLVTTLLPTTGRSARVVEWIRHPENHPDWSVRAGTRCAAEAPFLMPTDGLIGYLWGDSFRPGHRHTGLDIFGGGPVGVTPVVAAYDGYLWRLPEWKSAVIVRVPSDPLQPGRQIWLYYTHMADPQGNSFISSEFPPGTTEKFIQAGTFLGYQGNYTGNPANPSGVHLHFSIVLSDSDGKFLNELKIQNTLDPSPYFGLPLNAKTAPDEVIVCSP